MINLIKKIKYLFQSIAILFLFSVFKLLGLKNSRLFASKVFVFCGPLFRSNVKTITNIEIAFPNTDENFKKKIIYEMWLTYGKILSEYNYIKDFREKELGKKIEVEGQIELEKIKKNKQPVIFISGHFDNFELMAMHIEKSGIDLAAIYRPLNNQFLNPIMENIRKKYICKNQIKKGLAGLKKLIKLKKKNYSTALMIDQRVSEGILSPLFNERALTTTIPAQLVKKFNIPIVPVYIERINGLKYKITINQPLSFPQDTSQKEITDNLNQILEKFILSKPENWIWSHNRWK